MYAQQHNDKSVEIAGSRDPGNRTEFNFSNDVLSFPTGKMHATTRTLVLGPLLVFFKLLRSKDISESSLLCSHYSIPPPLLLCLNYDLSIPFYTIPCYVLVLHNCLFHDARQFSYSGIYKRLSKFGNVSNTLHSYPDNNSSLVPQLVVQQMMQQHAMANGLQQASGYQPTGTSLMKRKRAWPGEGTPTPPGSGNGSTHNPNGVNTSGAGIKLELDNHHPKENGGNNDGGKSTEGLSVGTDEMSDQQRDEKRLKVYPTNYSDMLPNAAVPPMIAPASTMHMQSPFSQKQISQPQPQMYRHGFVPTPPVTAIGQPALVQPLYGTPLRTSNSDMYRSSQEASFISVVKHKPSAPPQAPPPRAQSPLPTSHQVHHIQIQRVQQMQHHQHPQYPQQQHPMAQQYLHQAQLPPRMHTLGKNFITNLGEDGVPQPGSGGGISMQVAQELLMPGSVDHNDATTSPDGTPIKKNPKKAKDKKSSTCSVLCCCLSTHPLLQLNLPAVRRSILLIY